jgi:uroporphyrinogen decarboxylase
VDVPPQLIPPEPKASDTKPAKMSALHPGHFFGYTMSALKNDTFLRALLRQPTDYTPLWLMRQAGRYLPEYNATRARAGDFLTLCKTPDLATEVTLQPLARYPLDAAILFSDILTVPDAMGLGLYFSQGEGPRFERPLRDEWEIRDLSAPDPTDKLGYVMDAVKSIRRALDGSVPLIGFSGSPYTLACYMVEGAGSTDYRHIKTMLYSRPDLLHRILEVNTRAVTDYLNAQIEAGAQAVMIFDSWGGSLTPHAYKEFSLSYMERIVGLDWTVDIGEARRRVGDKVALQGNLDPCALHGTPESIRAEAARIITSYGNHPGHVFNLGHGISQFTDPDNVSVLVEAVHSQSRVLREARPAA